ncbi:DUF4160 domain-containing protein [Pedobacter sp. GSP4]|uniref:DUF4160 domain-containing protein n=1 Tax=Pedobacter sp. GSP4 TaxID=3453716 RepID=UPI003EEE2E14
MIYSNDHLPPHFHVKSNDLKIDAKFLITTGELRISIKLYNPFRTKLYANLTAGRLTKLSLSL